jgi:hypothetical protein
LPEVLDGVQLGGPRRQWQDGDVVGQIELGCGVLAGLIHDEDGVGTGLDGGADLVEMSVHRVGVAPGQDEADGLATGRTDGTEDVDPLGALVVRGAGSRSTPGPAARYL